MYVYNEAWESFVLLEHTFSELFSTLSVCYSEAWESFVLLEHTFSELVHIFVFVNTYSHA